MRCRSMDNVCNRRLFSIPCKTFFKFWKVLSINDVDPTTSSNAMNAFASSKERVRISLSGKRCSLQSVCKARSRTCRLKNEASGPESM